MPSDSSKPRDFSKLKELLDSQEKFPHDFPLKFIGRNTPEFKAGVQKLEDAHPTLRLQHARESSGGNHLAMTYLFLAQDSNEIIAILEEVARIDHVLVML